jgi:hypothetical protein
MATLLDTYDLTGGDVRTSTITTPTQVEIATVLTTVSGRVTYHAERLQTVGVWIPVRDEKGKPIIFQTNNVVNNGINLLGLGGSTFSLWVVPGDNTTGTVLIDAIHDGTIV